MEKIAKFIGTGDADFNRWKRKNVTVRGVKEMGKDNNVYSSYGVGLYTAFLSNMAMAKGYGKVYYVVNAIPKHPKVVNSVNYAEMFVQSLVKDVCDKHNQPYSVNFFNQHSTIEDEAMKKGFDGLIIKGREMVNYKPPQDVKYFDSLDNLYEYYKDIK